MRKVVVFVALLLMANVSLAQKEWKPADTEVWEPEPKKVKPGLLNGAPSDAIVLLGNDLEAWESGKKEPAGWEISDGVATVKPGTGAIFSKKSFGSIQLHLEWRAPVVVPGSQGQGRGNSGVFLQKYYEVQVLDSYENRTYSNGQAGSVYKQHSPLVNATRPPMEWQTYDIIYSAPEFEGNDLKKPAYVTVIHNGIVIQNPVEIKGATAYIGPPSYTAHGKLPIMLQDHGNLVSFRNIWVRELD